MPVGFGNVLLFFSQWISNDFDKARNLDPPFHRDIGKWSIRRLYQRTVFAEYFTCNKY